MLGTHLPLSRDIYSWRPAGNCHFDGVGDYAFLSGGLNPGYQQRSRYMMSCWVFFTTVTAVNPIMGAYPDTTTNYAYCGTASDGRMFWYKKLGGVVTQLVYSTATVSLGSWQHLAWSYDDSEGTAANRIQFYLNGVLSGQTVATSIGAGEYTYFGGRETHRIGYAPSSQFFPGYISEITAFSGWSIQNGDVALSDFIIKRGDRYWARDLEDKFTGLDGQFYLPFRSEVDLLTDYSASTTPFVWGKGATPSWHLSRVPSL